MRTYGLRKLNASAKRVQLQRWLRFESLESRHLMAGLVTLDTNYNPGTYSTNLVGLPLLHSSSSANGAVYLDYDGYDSNGDGDWSDSGERVPFDRDGNPASFSASEQAIIVDVVRKVGMGLSMFDIDVTTEQPTTKPFSWLIMTSATNGGGLAAYNSFGFPSSPGNNRANGNSPYVILHEAGHTFGLRHDSTYDTLGVANAEYGDWSDNIDYFHGMIMGGHDGALATYNNWHTNSSVSSIQDDIPVIAARIFSQTGVGDGYRIDGGNSTAATATTMTAIAGNANSYLSTGSIERAGDADFFKFAPTTTGFYSFVAGRDGAYSPVNLKLSILNSAGTVVYASEDGDPKVPFTVDAGGVTPNLNYDHNLRVWLTSGTTYVMKVESHGNYSDRGQYVVRTDLLGTAATDLWQSENLGQSGVAGFADINSGVYTVAGSGYDLDGVIEDRGHFLYQILQGNGEIIAHVAGIPNSSGGWSGTGIMMRESLDTNARSVSLQYTSSGTYDTIRSTVGGTSSGHVAGTAYTWLRIVRSGANSETFTTYGKVNSGDSWTQISATTITGLTGKVHIGLQSYDGARKAFKDQTLTVGTLDNVSIVLGTGGVLNPDLATNALTIPTITVGTVAHNSVAITWNNVSGDNGYIVERSSDRINWTQISGALSSSTFSYTDSTVNEAQTYYYLVRAKTGTTTPAYSVRASGGNQPGTSITTKAGPVTDIRMIAASVSEIVLDWREASGEASYTIRRKLSSSGTWSTIASGLAANTTVYADSGLTANTSYDYQIRTVRPDGTTVDTATQTVYTRQTSTVANTRITARTSSSLTVSWDAYAGATSYIIYKQERSGSDGGGEPWTWGGTSYAVGEVTAPTLSYTDTEALGPVDVVFYFVVAVTPNGDSTANASSTIMSSVPTDDVLPSPWTSYDTGPVGGPGAFKLYPDDELITLYASGTDLFGNNDAYRNATIATTGTNEIFGKVVANQGGYAGLMIRESDSPSSRSVFIGEYKSGSTTGGYIEIRSTTGGSSVETPLASYIPGTSLLSLYRNGNQIKGYISNNDGATWSTVINVTMSGLSSTMLYQLVYTNLDSSDINGADFTMVSTMQDGPLFPPSLLRSSGSGSNAESPNGSSAKAAFLETRGVLFETASQKGIDRAGSFTRQSTTRMNSAEDNHQKFNAADQLLSYTDSRGISSDIRAENRPSLFSKLLKDANRKRDAFFSLTDFDL